MLVKEILEVYCPGTGGQCQVGYYCGEGETTAIPCPAGTFADEAGAVRFFHFFFN